MRLALGCAALKPSRVKVSPLEIGLPIPTCTYECASVWNQVALICLNGEQTRREQKKVGRLLASKRTGSKYKSLFHYPDSFLYVLRWF